MNKKAISKSEIDHLEEHFPHLDELFNKNKINSQIKDIKDKEKLITTFLSLKGFGKQHIDSYNNFIDNELQKLITSKRNQRIQSDVDPKFYIEYKKIAIEKPIHEIFDMSYQLSPFECRGSNLTYEGNLLVNVDFYYEDQLFEQRKINIGKMPIMLGSSKCHLANKSYQELIDLKECPYDPKGYFIVKGTEKVCLIQEQMAKNRIIVEYNPKIDDIVASVASSTLDTKTKITLQMKQGKLYVKSNSFTEQIPVLTLFKAMGMESEQQILQIIGTQKYFIDTFSLCLQDINSRQIYSQTKALEYLATKLKISKYYESQKKSTGRSGVDEVKEILAR